MDRSDPQWPERRKAPRVEMFAGVFLVQGEKAYLTEMKDISAAGLAAGRPGNWHLDAGGSYQLFCILDQERILCIQGRVAHEAEGSIGFAFDASYAVQAEQLLAESRNWR